MNWIKIFDTRRRVLLAVARTEEGRRVVRRYPTEVEHRTPSEVWVKTPPGGPFDAGVVQLSEAVNIELGDETGLFSFPAIVRRRADCFHIDCLVLQLDGDPVHRQRRGHVRVPANAPVTIRHGGGVYKGWLRNLSAGGMLVHLDGKIAVFAVDELLRFQLHAAPGEQPVGEPMTIHGEARVVRSESPGVYALDFSGLSESHRQWIVRYVFRRQIELRRRGIDISI